LSAKFAIFIGLRRDHAILLLLVAACGDDLPPEYGDPITALTYNLAGISEGDASLRMAACSRRSRAEIRSTSTPPTGA
jgi:hypothetical protein